MFDETFWVALAFVIFVAAVYKPVSRKMADALDSRAQKINLELDEAVRLREEAQALLAGYERRQNEALEEAEDILAHAHEEAERQTRQAGEALDELIRRREAQENTSDPTAQRLDATFRLADRILANDGDLVALYAAVDDLLAELERPCDDR